eukprot:CAMPEP_0115296934 /NCGR_PEP_ID=MMETSP0270-20121206/67491_1 /TAXON_ID=71861 /ORGANISM="Scrippsiella trochoidea, Strain CCMP3099" /LENGTH=951 /DNA_ID=CAMNT_0002714581 /DNA_START=86 /DNA_END=2941 /DNA_ORIENTATION=-
MADVGPTFCFAPLDEAAFERTTAVCLGTGRFLRAVLVPALVELGGEVVLAQTRGTSFGAYMQGRKDSRTYEVDTVLQDGKVLTSRVPVAACGSLGVPAGRAAFMALPAKLPKLRFVGLGLTEAGIVHNGKSILDLAEFLHACFVAGLAKEHPLSMVNTDNMPFNGDAIKNHVHSCDYTQGVPRSEEFQQWLRNHVVFHNTMVDRITSHRTGQPDVPRAEPLPAKALVIEDLTGALPQQLGSVPGVVVRSKPKLLELDIALKLRIANGLHTAMVYAMSLGRIFQTDGCIGHPDILPYLEQLFERDIAHACTELSMPRLQVTPVFGEWMSRLQHPHFGLGCLFVCQNAMQKMGIRLLPSVKATLAAGEEPSLFMVFALAVILRFLTPVGEQTKLSEQPPVFVGYLDAAVEEPQEKRRRLDPAAWEYTPGLWAHPSEGTYEFRDGDGLVPMLLRPLGRPGGCSVAAAVSITSDVLSRLEGFDPRGCPEHGRLARAVGMMLQRMLQGEPAMHVLASLRPQQPLLLQEKQLEEAVRQEVEAAEAVDVHTHLFPAGHGTQLMRYGIDAMLTYHYLVSEYLATSTDRPAEFYALQQKEQAERVWQGLFVKASPISEPCRGVLTTLNALGLRKEVAARDLEAIRTWYEGQDEEMFNEKMMRLARLRYVVTSHDPFEPRETASCLEPPTQAPRYRSALALDKLLEGDWSAICHTLKEAGKPCTLRGATELLQRCLEALQPIFLTAATPHAFSYEQLSGSPQEELLDAALDSSSAQQPPTPQQVLDLVVLPLCRSAGLPLSLRMGTQRGVCPELRMAGDGVGSAQLGSLAQLCRGHPQIKFMATVLSRGDQHEAAIMASKFRNLHVWGCWWYCNNPSVVSEVTALRLEMLGTGFTFQTSSARVHDQLIYKWIHARSLLAKLLTSKYVELMSTGWCVSRGDVRRDVLRLLGGAFEDFLAKPL